MAASTTQILQQGCAIFSTDNGKQPPRPAGDPRPAPIVRSDPQADMITFIKQLRERYPHECRNIFTLTEDGRNWDIRWFFDEYDFHFLGGEFCFNMICKMATENQDHMIRLCKEWLAANAENMEMVMALGPERLFHERDQRNCGPLFLWRCVAYLRERYQAAQRQDLARGRHPFDTPANRATEHRNVTVLPQSPSLVGGVPNLVTPTMQHDRLRRDGLRSLPPGLSPVHVNGNAMPQTPLIVSSQQNVEGVLPYPQAPIATPTASGQIAYQPPSYNVNGANGVQYNPQSVNLADLPQGLQVGAHSIGNDATHVRSLIVRGQRDLPSSIIQAGLRSFVSWVDVTERWKPGSNFLVMTANFANTADARKLLERAHTDVKGHSIRFEVPYRFRTFDLPGEMHHDQSSPRDRQEPAQTFQRGTPSSYKKKSHGSVSYPGQSQAETRNQQGRPRGFTGPHQVHSVPLHAQYSAQDARSGGNNAQQPAVATQQSRVNAQNDRPGTVPSRGGEIKIGKTRKASHDNTATAPISVIIARQNQEAKALKATDRGEPTKGVKAKATEVDSQHEAFKAPVPQSDAKTNVKQSRKASKAAKTPVPSIDISVREQSSDKTAADLGSSKVGEAKKTRERLQGKKTSVSAETQPIIKSAETHEALNAASDPHEGVESTPEDQVDDAKAPKASEKPQTDSTNLLQSDATERTHSSKDKEPSDLAIDEKDDSGVSKNTKPQNDMESKAVPSSETVAPAEKLPAERPTISPESVTAADEPTDEKLELQQSHVTEASQVSSDQASIKDEQQEDDPQQQSPQGLGIEIPGGDSGLEAAQTAVALSSPETIVASKEAGNDDGDALNETSPGRLSHTSSTETLASRKSASTQRVVSKSTPSDQSDDSLKSSHPWRGEYARVMRLVTRAPDSFDKTATEEQMRHVSEALGKQESVLSSIEERIGNGSKSIRKKFAAKGKAAKIAYEEMMDDFHMQAEQIRNQVFAAKKEVENADKVTTDPASTAEQKPSEDEGKSNEGAAKANEENDKETAKSQKQVDKPTPEADQGVANRDPSGLLFALVDNRNPDPHSGSTLLVLNERNLNVNPGSRYRSKGSGEQTTVFDPNEKSQEQILNSMKEPGPQQSVTMNQLMGAVQGQASPSKAKSWAAIASKPKDAQNEMQDKDSPQPSKTAKQKRGEKKGGAKAKTDELWSVRPGEEWGKDGLQAGKKLR
ncbi:MAG: hypothetical protein M1828_002622 [Chrysothrix sp. TS-e1954]|nr:MAG: hypothetical protein M1828_002622 [Chrysothrix sp. TS-e1954]